MGRCALYLESGERFDGSFAASCSALLMLFFEALNEQKTEIRIQFKDVTSGIFKNIPRNELVIRVQPNESVYIKMNSKLPGLSMQTVVTELDLTYRRRFSDIKIPEAYESLILDALKGDHSNFVRNDELDASWRIFTPLLHYLDTNEEITPMEYPYGMQFPLERAKISAKDPFLTNRTLGSRGPPVLDDFTLSYGYKFGDIKSPQ